MALPGWLVPLVAGLVGGVFAATVWGQWSAGRRPSQLAWAGGLTMYAVASLIDAYVADLGWSVPLYRAFFVLAAANVGVLGLGTVLLAGPSAWTRAFAALVLGAIAVAAAGQFAVPLTASTPVTIEGATKPLSEWGSELGAKAIPFPNPGRIAFLALNVVGGLALIVGALVSWWQTRRLGVLLIALGAMVPFAGGSLSTLFALDLRVAAQLVGICLMYAGFLRAREAPGGARPLPTEA